MHAEIRLGESSIAPRPDRFCCCRTEEFVNAEVTAQLHVNPVMHRVAQGLWDCLGPGLEFFPWRGIACDQSLCDAVGTHQSPLVVVATQPELGDVLPSMVLCNFLRREMAVVIINRLVFGDFMKEALGCLGE